MQYEIDVLAIVIISRILITINEIHNWFNHVAVTVHRTEW